MEEEYLIPRLHTYIGLYNDIFKVMFFNDEDRKFCDDFFINFLVKGNTSSLNKESSKESIKIVMKAFDDLCSLSGKKIEYKVVSKSENRKLFKSNLELSDLLTPTVINNY